MAVSAAAQWWVRPAGNAINASGFDASLAGAGTNYADQDAAQVVFSAGNSNLMSTTGAGATRIASAGTPFTSAMVGNCIRPFAGTNWVPGYYFVTNFVDSSHVDVDRSPTPSGAGSSGAGTLGGAAADLGSFANGGTLGAPTVTSPLVAGNTINIRGAGTDTPTSADYTHTGGYWEFPAGDVTGGRITFCGYNGRPCFFTAGLFLRVTSYHRVTGLKFIAQNATNGTTGIVADINGRGLVDNCHFDQNGYQVTGAAVHRVLGCLFKNTGAGGSSTSTTGVTSTVGGGLIAGNVFKNWRGFGIYHQQSPVTIARNVIVSCTEDGIYVSAAGTNGFPNILGNTIYSAGGNGIYIEDGQGVVEALIRNNLIIGCGAYGINAAVGSAALNDRRAGAAIDYNAFYNNTSGARNNISAGAHDVTLSGDPFNDAAGGDFTLNSTAGAGAAVDDTAFPTSFPS